MRIRIVEPSLFVRKTLSVFVLAFALLPLISLKSQVPALAYIGALVVLHIGVLGVYFYRVRFRELDPDWRSLVARVAGLGLMVYLLLLVSKFDAEAPMSTLAMQMGVVSVLHTLVLLFLMARVDYGTAPALEGGVPASTPR